MLRYGGDKGVKVITREYLDLDAGSRGAVLEIGAAWDKEIDIIIAGSRNIGYPCKCWALACGSSNVNIGD